MEKISYIDQHLFNQSIIPLKPWIKKDTVAVAVSGGADSMALCFLMKTWCSQHNKNLLALTVDHRLRPEATHEARWVHDFLTRHGLSHEILTWGKNKPETSIQEKAREARYHLLSHACQKYGIGTLFLGHHFDDLWETVCFRFLRKSGLEGLAGMASVVPLSRDVFGMRPLLSFSKQALTTFLKHQKTPWIEDPTNQNTFYVRGFLRQVPKNVPWPVSFSVMIPIIRRWRHVKDKRRLDLMQKYCYFHDLGYVTLDLSFFNLPSAVSKDLLKAVIYAVGGQSRGLKEDTLEKALYHLKALTFKKMTLGGCYLGTFHGFPSIFREMRHDPYPMTPVREGQYLWDRRLMFSAGFSKNLKKSPGFIGIRKASILRKCLPELYAIPLLALATCPDFHEDVDMMSQYFGLFLSQPLSQRSQEKKTLLWRWAGQAPNFIIG